MSVPVSVADPSGEGSEGNIMSTNDHLASVKDHVAALTAIVSSCEVLPSEHVFTVVSAALVCLRREPTTVSHASFVRAGAFTLISLLLKLCRLLPNIPCNGPSTQSGRDSHPHDIAITTLAAFLSLLSSNTTKQLVVTKNNEMLEIIRSLSVDLAVTPSSPPLASAGSESNDQSSTCQCNYLLRRRSWEGIVTLAPFLVDMLNTKLLLILKNEISPPVSVGNQSPPSQHAVDSPADGLKMLKAYHRQHDTGKTQLATSFVLYDGWGPNPHLNPQSVQWTQRRLAALSVDARASLHAIFSNRVVVDIIHSVSLLFKTFYDSFLKFNLNKDVVSSVWCHHISCLLIPACSVVATIATNWYARSVLVETAVPSMLRHLLHLLHCLPNQQLLTLEKLNDIKFAILCAITVLSSFPESCDALATEWSGATALVDTAQPEPVHANDGSNDDDGDVIEPPVSVVGVSVTNDRSDDSLLGVMMHALAVARDNDEQLACVSRFLTNFAIHAARYSKCWNVDIVSTIIDATSTTSAPWTSLQFCWCIAVLASTLCDRDDVMHLVVDKGMDCLCTLIRWRDDPSPEACEIRQLMTTGGVRLLPLVHRLSLRTYTAVAAPPDNMNDCYRNWSSGDWEMVLTMLPSFFRLDPSNIVVGDKIGAGASSVVCRGELKTLTGVCNVAIKQLYPSVAAIKFISETCIMCSTHSPYIVKSFGYVADEAHGLWLVMELCSGGNLAALLRSISQTSTPIHFPRSTRLRIALCVAKAVNYMHLYQPPLCHRDLKTSNIFFHSTPVIANDSVQVTYAKLGDFGVSKFVNKGVEGVLSLPEDRAMTGHRGTLQYMAPEVLTNFPYNTKCDVFSFGIVLWELISGEIPYSIGVYRSLSPSDLSASIVSGARPVIPPSSSVAMRALIEQCWSHSPSDRPPFIVIIKELKEQLNTAIVEEGVYKPSSLVSSLSTVIEPRPEPMTSAIDENRTTPPRGTALPPSEALMLVRVASARGYDNLRSQFSLKNFNEKINESKDTSLASSSRPSSSATMCCAPSPEVSSVPPSVAHVASHHARSSAVTASQARTVAEEALKKAMIVLSRPLSTKAVEGVLTPRHAAGYSSTVPSCRGNCAFATSLRHQVAELEGLVLKLQAEVGRSRSPAKSTPSVETDDVTSNQTVTMTLEGSNVDESRQSVSGNAASDASVPISVDLGVAVVGNMPSGNLDVVSVTSDVPLQPGDDPAAATMSLPVGSETLIETAVGMAPLTPTIEEVISNVAVVEGTETKAS